MPANFRVKGIPLLTCLRIWQQMARTRKDNIIYKEQSVQVHFARQYTSRARFAYYSLEQAGVIFNNIKIGEAYIWRMLNLCKVMLNLCISSCGNGREQV